MVVLGHKSTSWMEAARFKVREAFNGRPPCSSATTTSVSRLRSPTKDDVTKLLFSGYASEGCPSLASFLVDFGLMILSLTGNRAVGRTGAGKSSIFCIVSFCISRTGETSFPFIGVALAARGEPAGVFYKKVVRSYNSISS